MKNCKVCNKPISIDDQELTKEFSFLANLVTICSPECKLKKKQIEWAEQAQKRYDELAACFPEAHEGAQLSDFGNIKEDWIVTRVKDSDPPRYVNKPVIPMINRWLSSDYWLLFLQSEESDTGKTRLGLVALAEEARAGNLFKSPVDSVGYEKAHNLASYIASERLKQKKPLTELYADCNVLMIDELGDEGDAKSYEVRAMSNLLQLREERKKRTIITSNLKRDDIPLMYGARLYSRIKKGILTKKGINRR